ncbi:MAG: purine phosphorylase [Deltaproteobacteria bacterium]|nr:purine phosphorylase [Deltaproteobacteria bacterium]
MSILGIVVALESEAGCLPWWRTSGGKDLGLPEGVRLKLSGIGADLAGSAALAQVSDGVGALLSLGTAAGLHPELAPGGVVLPQTILTCTGATFTTDPDWRDRVQVRLQDQMPVHPGPLIQSPSVLTGPADKSTLSRTSGAAAADMESAAVAAVAAEHHLPFLAIRVITDPVDAAVPVSALAAVDQFGRVQPWALIRSLAKHPQDILPLIRLGRHFQAAQSTLTAIARLVGPTFLAP